MIVLITEPLDCQVLNDYQSQHPEIQFWSKYNFVHLNLSKQLELIDSCDGLIIRSQTKLNSELIRRARKLKIIVSACVGFDNVDMEMIQKKGIVHFSCANGNTDSTAEHILAMIFGLSKNIVMANNSVKSGGWKKNELMSDELVGKTLGIIGLGRIGKTLARKTLGLGLKVLAYDPLITTNKWSRVKLVALSSLLRESDYVSLCVPLTTDTKNLLSEYELSLMKPTSYLINCARGEVVNEKALYNACKAHKIQGAALDVFSGEPDINLKLARLDNVLVSPHIAGQTRESLRRNTELAMLTVINYLEENK